jgi:hypothetical protein
MVHAAGGLIVFGGVRVVALPQIILELGGAFTQVVPAAQQDGPVASAKARGEGFRQAGDRRGRAVFPATSKDGELTPFTTCTSNTAARGRRVVWGGLRITWGQAA